MGCSGQIQGDNLVEVLEKFAEQNNSIKEAGLFLDSATLVFKDESGKLMGFGNNGIETAINKLYGEPITQKVGLLFHHS